MNESKEKLIQILNMLEIPELVHKPLVAFIESYKNSDEFEFNLLMLALIQFFKQYNIIKIKADGFDKLAVAKKEFEEEIKELKIQYKTMLETPPNMLIPVVNKEEDLLKVANSTLYDE